MAFREWISLIRSVFEAVGIVVLIIGTGSALCRFGYSFLHRQADVRAFHRLREGIGQSILLGLEFLVAADIIASVAIDPTLISVGVLGLIVIVRTFLSWALDVEITGSWPWQKSTPLPLPPDANAPHQP